MKAWEHQESQAKEASCLFNLLFFWTPFLSDTELERGLEIRVESVSESLRFSSKPLWFTLSIQIHLLQRSFRSEDEMKDNLRKEWPANEIYWLIIIQSQCLFHSDRLRQWQQKLQGEESSVRNTLLMCRTLVIVPPPDRVITAVPTPSK